VSDVGVSGESVSVSWNAGFKNLLTHSPKRSSPVSRVGDRPFKTQTGIDVSSSVSGFLSTTTSTSHCCDDSSTS